MDDDLKASEDYDDFELTCIRQYESECAAKGIEPSAAGCRSHLGTWRLIRAMWGGEQVIRNRTHAR